MTASNEPQIIRPDGTIDRELVCHLATRAYLADGAGARAQVNQAAATNKPWTFEGAFALFSPVLEALNSTSARDAATAMDRFRVAGAWMVELGLDEKQHLNAMLAREEGMANCWLMEAGADPNAVLDPSSPEQLTVIGHVCREMGKEWRDEDTVRHMIYQILTKGEIPHSVKPRFEGDAQGCDLVEAIMTDVDGAGMASNVMFEAMRDAAKEKLLPKEINEAVRRVCVDLVKSAKWIRSHMGNLMGQKALDYACLSPQEDWNTAVVSFPREEVDKLMSDAETKLLGWRLLVALAGSRAGVDEVQTFITEDDIPCTLLQAAAFMGNERLVTFLIEAGANSSIPVAAGSDDYAIAGLDAKGLWNMDPKRGRSQVLEASAAKNTIDSVITKAKACRAIPTGMQ